jgi:hypothetical protein
MTPVWGWDAAAPPTPAPRPYAPPMAPVPPAAATAPSWLPQAPQAPPVPLPLPLPVPIPLPIPQQHHAAPPPSAQPTAEQLVSAQCEVCMDAPKGVFFASCGHVVACVACTAVLLAAPQPRCPVCREPLARAACLPVHL